MAGNDWAWPLNPGSVMWTSPCRVLRDASHPQRSPNDGRHLSLPTALDSALQPIHPSILVEQMMTPPSDKTRQRKAGRVGQGHGRRHLLRVPYCTSHIEGSEQGQSADRPPCFSAGRTENPSSTVGSLSAFARDEDRGGKKRAECVMLPRQVGYG